MSNFEEFIALPEDFEGTVRLFPLPNFVMFPGVLQPFHIFELRYREMLRDALDDDRLIALASLLPGSDSDYEGRPPVAQVVCVGRVITETRLEDGRYNIWLVGCRRARIVRELPPTRAFRLAEVELLDDVYTDSDSADSMSVPPELVEAFRRLVPDTAAGRKQVEQLLAVDIRLGTFADIVAFSADLDLSLKQQLLAECNVARRVAMLLENLAHAAPTRADSERHASGSYPIKFSDN